MNVFDQIQQLLPECTKNERRIAEHFLKWPYDVTRLSCEMIAQKIGVSRSAVVRFTHKLGFNGYSELRYAVIENHESMKSSEAEENTASSAMECYEECLHQISETFNAEETAYMTGKLLHANRVFVYGELHGAMFAKQMEFRLNRTGIDCRCISDSSILDAYISIVKPGDIIIITSITLTKESYILPTLMHLRKRRVTIILMTMDSGAYMHDLFDHVIVLPSAIYRNSRFMLDEAIPFFLATECIVEGIHSELDRTAGPNIDSSEF